MTTRPLVHVTEPIHADALRDLQGFADLAATPDGADGILVRVARLPAPGPRLRVVAKHGVGVDNLDLAALTAAGVRVMNTPGANAGAVAEHALMLMLALARDLPALQQAARSGRRPAPVVGLEGKRLLIVGFGASGQRLAHLARACGAKVLVSSPRLTGPRTDDGFEITPDLHTALPKVDVISLHCPLNDATRGLIGGRELALLPQGAFVINCARGGIIDESALCAALHAGHLGGAGLDTTLHEPLPPDDPLWKAPRLIVTPHAAALSDGAYRAMGIMAVQNLRDFFAGQPNPAHVVA